MAGSTLKDKMLEYPPQKKDVFASKLMFINKTLFNNQLKLNNQSTLLKRMTREEALRSYTLDCAYAAFQEEIVGSLTRGKLADITILSKDIMTVPDDEILSAEVVYTIVGGKVMYKK